MLEGIRSNPIIAGAYTNPEGICPMLAAHRAGGRTTAISFARAWDRFTFGRAGVKRPRPATPRELRILTAHLEASLLAEEAPDSALGAAIAAHRELLARQTHDTDRPGGADRSKEPATRPGWSWMRVVRRYDDYERALQRLAEEREALEARRSPAGVREPQPI